MVPLTVPNLEEVRASIVDPRKKPLKGLWKLFNRRYGDNGFCITAKNGPTKVLPSCIRGKKLL